MSYILSDTVCIPPDLLPAFFLAYLPTFFSDILCKSPGILSGILSGISSDTIWGISSDIPLLLLGLVACYSISKIIIYGNSFFSSEPLNSAFRKQNSMYQYQVSCYRLFLRESQDFRSQKKANNFRKSQLFNIVFSFTIIVIHWS